MGTAGKSIANEIDVWFKEYLALRVPSTKVETKLRHWFSKGRKKKLVDAFGELRKSEPDIPLRKIFEMILDTRMTEFYLRFGEGLDSKKLDKSLKRTSQGLRYLSLFLDEYRPFLSDRGEQILWEQISDLLEEVRPRITRMLEGPEKKVGPKPRTFQKILLLRLSSIIEDNDRYVVDIFHAAGYTRAEKESVRRFLRDQRLVDKDRK